MNGQRATGTVGYLKQAGYRVFVVSEKQPRWLQADEVAMGRTDLHASLVTVRGGEQFADSTDLLDAEFRFGEQDVGSAVGGDDMTRLQLFRQIAMSLKPDRHGFQSEWFRLNQPNFQARRDIVIGSTRTPMNYVASSPQPKELSHGRI
jgi:hypothetical protein